MASSEDGLPEVAGRHTTRALAGLELAAQRCIFAEQSKLSPDTALIGVLCDTVRLCREYCDAMKVVPPRKPASIFMLVCSGAGQCLSGFPPIFCKTAFASREAAEAEKDAFFKRCTTLDTKHLDSFDPATAKVSIREFLVVG